MDGACDFISIRGWPLSGDLATRNIMHEILLKTAPMRICCRECLGTLTLMRMQFRPAFELARVYNDVDTNTHTYFHFILILHLIAGN